jgi:nitroreductase/NAD-dependent dihydropyrimidine dehydrogenase PreA subunit
MSGSFRPNRFKNLSDPTVVTKPFSIIVDEEKCSGCGQCVKQCPCQTIILVDKKPQFKGHPYYGDICIACHSCEAICPKEALSFQHFYRVDEGRWAYDFIYPENPGDGLPNPLHLDKPKKLKEIETELTGTEKVIYSRRSTRVYKNKPVPKELIHRVLEAGRFAPSAGNCQGWKFVVVTDKVLLKNLSDAALKFLGLFPKIYHGKDPLRKMLKNTLAFVKPSGIDQRPMVAIQGLLTPVSAEKPGNMFFDAPCVVFLLTHHLHISDPNLDMGICGQNMVLAAHSLGLGTCYVGFASTALNMDPITKMKFHKKLGIEWPYNSVATCFALGYPAVQVDKPVDREFPQVKWVE